MSAGGDPTSYSYTPPQYTFPGWYLHTPGVYYWQASFFACDNSTFQCGYQNSPVMTLTVVAPPPPPPPPPTPVQHTEPIPGWIGHQVDRYHFSRAYVNDTVGPPTLDATVVLALATRSASRWGITIEGTTSASPDDQDGENTIGFSYSLPTGDLGETDIYYRKLYGRGRRRCAIQWQGNFRVRVCHRGRRRFLGTQVTEEDIRINGNVPWTEGPYYPDSGHYDLESTLLHELGHFAGNPAHVYGCTDSPMIDAAAIGDWWHAPDDWHRLGCAARDVGSRRAVTTPSGRGYYIIRYIDDSRGRDRRHAVSAILPQLRMR
jgi:hypothetical protein